MVNTQCKAQVYRRDTYRVSGTPGKKFKMHYSKGQCKRTATKEGFCSQHYKMKDFVAISKWAR